MGYDANKTFAQLIDSIQDRKGRAIEGAALQLKHLDGSAVAIAKNIFGNASGSVGGANPTFSDLDGYFPPYYRHGDYIAEWTAHGDTTSRVIRVPPIFEDFAMVDATKYDGIDPTGATDCSAAIDAALADCQGKFTLFFPPGNYKIANRVTLISNTVIKGAGPHLTTFVADDAFTGAMFFDGAAAIENCFMEDAGFDGRGAARASENPAIKFSGVSDRCFVRRCWILNAPYKIEGAVDQPGLNIFLESSNSAITDCIIGGGGGGLDGIWLGGARNSIVANNLIYDCGDDGISMWGSTECVIVGNVLSCMAPQPRAAGAGISIGTAKRSTITGNYIEGWERACIRVDQAGVTEECQITGNILAYGGGNHDATVWGDGILVRCEASDYQTNNNIANNVIFDPRECGIRVLTTGTLGLVTDFNIHSNMIINTRSNPNYTGAGNGILIDTDDSAVTTACKRVSIHGNYIKGYPGDGIKVYGSASNPVQMIQIENNKVYDSGTAVPLTEAYAIKLNYVTDFVVRNNFGADVQPIGDSQRGLWINNPAGSGVVSGNDFRQNISNISLSGMENLVYMVYRDNIGHVPFSGRYAVPSGAWTLVSGNVYKKTFTINFGFAINSAALVPRIVITTTVAGWFASVTAITDSNFTVDLVSTVGDPGSGASGTLHWQAEF